MNPKTDADLLFEEYLNGHNHAGFVYEEALPESLKVPDYQLKWKDVLHLFEVKGFDVPVQESGGFFDPYPPIRSKIKKAAEKFKDLEKYPCTLVLHNAGPGLVLLEPSIILGAMFGNVGFSVPIDLGNNPAPVETNIKNIFMKNGKMIQYGKGGVAASAINTTINAIVVVSRYPLGRKLFLQYIKTLATKRGIESLPLDEFFEEMEKIEGTDMDLSRYVVRVIVHENPYARMPLDRALFTGPFDEWYGANGTAGIGRVFAGDQITKLEPEP